MIAELYQEPHWFTGKIKTRCMECHKVAYRNEAEAKFRAEQISERQPMKEYLGKCGHWHITRKAQ